MSLRRNHSCKKKRSFHLWDPDFYLVFFNEARSYFVIVVAASELLYFDDDYDGSAYSWTENKGENIVRSWQTPKTTGKKMFPKQKKSESSVCLEQFKYGFVQGQFNLIWGTIYGTLILYM